MDNNHERRRLGRLRVAVRLILAFGMAVSMVANVLHAHSNLISQSIAAYAPAGLLLTVELISRIPSTHKGRAFVRITASAAVAAIAAWVSYWHMVGVAQRYGETGITPYLLPISVDGLIVVASISLVEVNGRIRQLETSHHTAVHGVAVPAAETTLVSPPSNGNQAQASRVSADPVSQFAAGLNRSTPTSPAVHNHHQVTPAGTTVQESLL